MIRGRCRQPTNTLLPMNVISSRSFRSQGHPLRQIARILGRNPGTVSRELRRNAPPGHTGYDLAHKAHTRSAERNRRARTHPRLKHAGIRRHVVDRLHRGWSPELIAGWLQRRHPDRAISHEAIYQWVSAEARHLSSSS